MLPKPDNLTRYRHTETLMDTLFGHIVQLCQCVKLHQPELFQPSPDGVRRTSAPPGSRREPSREASIERYLSALETADRQEGELAEGPVAPSLSYRLATRPRGSRPRAAGRSDFVPWRNWCAAVLIASLPTAAVRRIHDIAEKDRALNCRSYPKFYRPNSDASTSHPIACSRLSLQMKRQQDRVVLPATSLGPTCD